MMTREQILQEAYRKGFEKGADEAADISARFAKHYTPQQIVAGQQELNTPQPSVRRNVVSPEGLKQIGQTVQDVDKGYGAARSAYLLGMTAPLSIAYGGAAAGMSKLPAVARAARLAWRYGPAASALAPAAAGAYDALGAAGEQAGVTRGRVAADLVRTGLSTVKGNETDALARDAMLSAVREKSKPSFLTQTLRLANPAADLGFRALSAARGGVADAAQRRLGGRARRMLDKPVREIAKDIWSSSLVSGLANEPDRVRRLADYATSAYKQRFDNKD